MALLGKAFEYSIHCLSLLAEVPQGECRSVTELAQFQGVSPTYLAKVFTRLQKAGIIRSSKGVKGGYELAMNPEEVTFFDIAVAVEADLTLFECNNIRTQCVLYAELKSQPRWMNSGPCAGHRAMIEIEEDLKKLLKGRTLAWLHRNLNRQTPTKDRARGAEWFANVSKTRIGE